MQIAVVALGKIGLPLAVQFAGSGHQVIGVDINQTVVEQVNRAEEPFPGEAELKERLADVVGSGKLRATVNTAEAVNVADAVVVVVPLFVDADGVPDFGWMDTATEAIGSALKPGTLVSYETTLPIGTTRNRFGPRLEELSGLTLGENLFLTFSPERVFSGRIFQDLRRYPKLVGGVDEASTEAGIKFYEQVLEFDERPDLDRPNGVWNLGSSEASEMAKLAETTYRDVNIGLANQFAKFAGSNDINVYDVIEACNSQGFSHIHQPGIAVGGHCIPIYPRMYLWNDPEATIVLAAREANAAMPAYAVDELKKSFGDLAEAKVVVLGAAYRGGVKETAFSGVFATVEALRKVGADVYVHDPMYTDEELRSLNFQPFHLGEAADAAIVQTDHQEYRTLSPTDVNGIRVLMDGRRIVGPAPWAGITINTIGIGQPNGV